MVRRESVLGGPELDKFIKQVQTNNSQIIDKVFKANKEAEPEEHEDIINQASHEIERKI